MKRIALFLLSVLFFHLAHSQTWNSSCTPSGNMVATYRNDAFVLVLSHLQQANSRWKDSIDIPQQSIDTISNSLYAIENMAWSPLKDTILNLFGFRDFDTASTNSLEADSIHIHSAGFAGGISNNVFLKKIFVIPTAGSVLASEWAAGNYYNTSYPALNSFLSKYGIMVKVNSTIPVNYLLSFPRPVNTRVAAAKVSTMPDISYAQVQEIMVVGDGNYIKPTYQSDGIHLEYRNGCGDCPVGCTYDTRWYFKVLYNNCNVQYLGRIPIADGETAFEKVCSRGTVMANSFAIINASIKNNLPVIDWKIATDANIQKFIVERSADGKNFIGAATIAAEKRSSLSSYSWTDEQPFYNVNYYRIKALSLSGEIKYSAVVKVKVLSILQHTTFNIYPNPATTSVQLIFFKTIHDKVNVEIADMMGIVVLKKVFLIEGNTIPLSTQTLSAGIYIVKAMAGDELFKQKLVIGK